MTVDLSILFFLQLTIILGACRGVSWLAKYVGQPMAVGEMVAGVLLGPSLFGLLFPKIHEAIFVPDSMPVLYLLSQLGLTLYMFVVGIEFDFEHFQRNSRVAVNVSVAGMLAPFIVGGTIALWLHATGGFFTDETSRFDAVLFMAAAIGITAFPMLARIVVEKKLMGTDLGTITLAAGAINDVAAWCMLALIFAFTSGEWSGFMLTIGGGFAYATVVLFVLKPLFKQLAARAATQNGISGGQLTIVLCLVIFGGCVANAIGVHAVFGAFLIGCAIPRGAFSDSLRKQIEPLTLSLIVPLFFAYTGLKTRLDLVTTPWLLFVAFIVIIAACLGKGVACWGAARWSGLNHGMAMAVGGLMNARGMMGLILLVIGRERGMIGPELFSILVLMAIVTTLTATPVLRWIQTRYRLE